ncbi:hypothetical protein C9597_23690 [Salmonella enterica]|nr:hypothetical protein [Salmonella enterica]EBG5027097.1 hypothetical protein [Salmonella enterica subsp. enterica serovar Oranienburg]ECK2142537.1 hypothetical protein [Salmonella enterica subsp. enterica serovar Enteritidis]EAS1265670.1 hypothetical protein [Salmonella enterica]EBB1608306.1 hypothetical protein [Salmonella enterica]
MLSKTGFTHSELLCWQIDYAGGSLNVNGTIMRDTYTMTSGKRKWVITVVQWQKQRCSASKRYRVAI